MAIAHATPQAALALLVFPPPLISANLVFSRGDGQTANQFRTVIHKPKNPNVMNAVLTPLNVAVVGATGMVGRTMLDVLEARNFPVARLLPVASARSVGTTVRFK